MPPSRWSPENRKKQSKNNKIINKRGDGKKNNGRVSQNKSLSKTKAKQERKDAHSLNAGIVIDSEDRPHAASKWDSPQPQTKSKSPKCKKEEEKSTAGMVPKSTVLHSDKLEAKTADKIDLAVASDNKHDPVSTLSSVALIACSEEANIWDVEPEHYKPDELTLELPKISKDYAESSDELDENPIAFEEELEDQEETSKES